MGGNWIITISNLLSKGIERIDAYLEARSNIFNWD